VPFGKNTLKQKNFGNNIQMYPSMSRSS
jgi:hypothetical protein